MRVQWTTQMLASKLTAAGALARPAPPSVTESPPSGCSPVKELGWLAGCGGWLVGRSQSGNT